ncbi:MAG: HAMP domain-containing sensor histidine kinase [Chloroflexota bacterium]
MNAQPPRGPGLAIRLAIAFAGVAVATAAAVAIAAPPIVGRGFAMMQSGGSFAPGSGAGHGPGMGMGPGASGTGAYLAQAQQEATTTIIVVAIVAAAVASLLGIIIAWWIARPLVQLEGAATRVAAGDLAARSGIAQRSDELGSLGRSFDAMAADLEQSAASRRRFFADAAHEMKTPLAVIEATVAAVLDGVYDHDDRHLVTIKEQARLLGRVVDDLRTVSLAETGALPLAPVEIAPADAVAAAVRAFAARAEAAGVALAVDGDGAAGATVRADRDRLAQALGAYLDNALRYAPAESRVVVRAAVAPGGPGRVRISVLDSGSGVPADDLPHVFDRFYQADPARDRGAGTSGLGLAIVRALVEAQGGSVGASNRPEGGAEFWLELPTSA